LAQHYLFSTNDQLRPTPRNWQRGAIQNAKLRQTRCFNFPLWTFYLFVAALQQHLHISQLIRYSIACGSYQDFLKRGLLLKRKLLNQGFLLVKLKSSLRKLYRRHHDRHEISVSQITTDIFNCSKYCPFLIHYLSPGL
jgi:hypothetical protein